MESSLAVYDNEQEMSLVTQDKWLPAVYTTRKSDVKVLHLVLCLYAQRSRLQLHGSLPYMPIYVYV